MIKTFLLCILETVDGGPARETGKDSLSNLQKELVWVLIKARILKREFL